METTDLDFETAINPKGGRLPHPSRNKPSSAVAVPNEEGQKVEASIVIMRSASEVYAFLKDFFNYSKFIPSLEPVIHVAGGWTHWVLAPGGTFKLEWDLELITDRPGELIAWRSVDGGDVDTAGSIHLRALPGDRGTEVRVILKYDCPNETLKTRLKKAVGFSAADGIMIALHHLKALVETGEIPTTVGQPHGARGMRSLSSFLLVKRESP